MLRRLIAFLATAIARLRDRSGTRLRARSVFVSGSALDFSSRPQQGQLGDCWFMAPLLAMHETDPAAAQRLFVEQGEDRTTVRLFRHFRPIQVRVNTRILVGPSGRPLFARQDGGTAGWASLVEKAAVELHGRNYAAFARGFAYFGLTMLTGQAVRTRVWKPGPARIARLLENGHVLVASTGFWARLVKDGGPKVAAMHVYAVVGADPDTGLITVRNPWGTSRGNRPVITLTNRQFRRRFLSLDHTLKPLRR